MDAVRDDDRASHALTGVAMAALVLMALVGTQLACRPQARETVTPMPTQPPVLATASALMRETIARDFAGDYTCHGSHFYGASLSVASDLGYVWEDRLEFMCSGEEGQVVVIPDRVWLVPEVEWDTCERKDEDVTRVPEVVRKASAKLIPVKWGRCRLLVPEAQLASFCRFLAEGKVECDCHTLTLDFSGEECLCYGRVGGVTHEGRPVLPDGTPVCP